MSNSLDDKHLTLRVKYILLYAKLYNDNKEKRPWLDYTGGRVVDGGSGGDKPMYRCLTRKGRR